MDREIENGSGIQFADFSHTDKPMLCVNVDTEEDFQWDKGFSRENISTESLEQLPVSHKIFRNYGIRPTYLVDYPIISDPEATEMLRGWAQADECLVGAQLHPWVNPPYEEVVCTQNSYPCNLNPALEKSKLSILTKAITEAIGTAPRIYKAGRYGLDIRRIAHLAEQGYYVDTSVTPFRSYSGTGGGPDFFGFPSKPFWLETQQDVLFLPATVEMVGLLRHIGRKRLSRHLFSRLASRMHLPGMLARTGLLERIMLTPEGVSEEELLRLLDCMVSDGYKMFCFSFHSPTLMVGCTPYTRNEAELKTFLRRIEVVLDYFFGKLGGVATDPMELYRRLHQNGSKNTPKD